MSLVTLPITFNAIGAAAPGAPLESLTRTVSALQADDALVKVSYSSINPLDVKILQYNFLQLPMPMVAGFDFSGVVVALGTEGAYAGESEAITLGAAVFGQTFGMGQGAGCFAEYVVVPRKRLVLRGDIPEAEAATYSVAYASAYDPLLLATDISKRGGQTIFIPGGSGGVGHFAVQLAKTYGLRVITSASKPEGLELLHKLRADIVLDYSKQDVVAEVLAATGGKGADIVYDSTYQPSSLNQSASVVAKGGQWIRLGTWMREPPALKEQIESIVSSRGASVLFGDLGRYTLDPAYQAKAPQLQDGLRLARQLYVEGHVRPHVTSTVPLEVGAMQAAIQESAKSTVGKKVVKVQ